MICIMAAFGLITAIVCGSLEKMEIGSRMALIFISMLFQVMFVLGMEMYRMKKGWFHEKANNYTRITISFCICCVATVLFLFLPDYIRPILLIAVGMTIVTNSFLGMLAGIFYVVVLNISGNESIYQLLWAFLLLGCGAMMVDFLKERANRKWAAFVMADFDS